MDVKKSLSTIIGHVSSITLNIYAHSEEECEKLLAELIAEMKAILIAG